MAESEANIAKKSSSVNTGRYSYTFVSLADFARQNFKIPKMRTACTELGEYIEYLDDDGEWQQGARVVIPNNPSANDAQNYGGALSYARRYTVALYNAVATDDDESVEHIPATTPAPAPRGIDLDWLQEQLDMVDDNAGVDAVAIETAKKYPNMTEKQKALIKSKFDKKRAQVGK